MIALWEESHATAYANALSTYFKDAVVPFTGIA
jgi:hypothetical protein